MVILLATTILIIGIILSIQDYKTYSISAILLCAYAFLISCMLFKLNIPLFFIPVICLFLLFIKFEKINNADIIIMCILLYFICILKFYYFNPYMLIPLACAFIIIFIFNKNTIPYIVVGSSLITIYIIWLLHILSYI